MAVATVVVEKQQRQFMESTLMQGVQQQEQQQQGSAGGGVPVFNTNGNNANSGVAEMDQLLQQDTQATSSSIQMEDHTLLSSEEDGTTSSSASSRSPSSSPDSLRTEDYTSNNTGEGLYTSHHHHHHGVQTLKPTASAMSVSHGLLSPIAGDVPMISQVTSPSLPPFKFASTATEQGSDGSNTDPHSPNTPTAAKLHSISASLLKSAQEVGIATSLGGYTTDSFSQNSLSPVPVTSISPHQRVAVNSPPHSFQQSQQQGLMFDHRISELSVVPSSILFPPTLTTLTTTAPPLGNEDVMEEGKLYVCMWDECGHEFTTLSSLVSHLDRGHTLSMNKYVCLWKNCSRNQKPFDARYKLITHLRCHTGEKPYRCEVPSCKRSFSRLENLKLHIRTHTGEKPYECHYDGCTKKFNNTSDRAKHMKTHITRKPYACKYPGCGKSYTDPSSMRKHIKYTHKMKEKRELEQQQNHIPSFVKVNGDIGLQKPSPSSAAPLRSMATSTTSPYMPKTVIIGKQQTPVPVVDFSPVGSAMPFDSRLLHPLHSPPPPSTGPLVSPSTPSHMINGSGSSAPIMAIANQQQGAQLIPLVQLPHTRGQSSKGQSLNVMQQSGQPVLVPTASPGSAQQPVIMVLANSSGVSNSVGPVLSHSVTATAGSVSLAASQQPTRVVSISPPGEQTKSSNSSEMSNATSLRLMERGNDNNESGSHSMPSESIEAQLRLQIAHLQQQLYHSQAQTQMLAMQQQQLAQKQNGEEQQTYVQLQVSSSESPPQLVLPTSLAVDSKGASPSKVAIATTTQSTLPISGFTPVVSPQLVSSQQRIQQQQQKQQHSTNKPTPILLTNSLQPVMSSGQTVVHPFLFSHGTHVIPIVQSQDVSGQYLCMTPNP